MLGLEANLSEGERAGGTMVAHVIAEDLIFATGHVAGALRFTNPLFSLPSRGRTGPDWTGACFCHPERSVMTHAAADHTPAERKLS